MIFGGNDTTFINESKVKKIQEIKSSPLNENNEDKNDKSAAPILNKNKNDKDTKDTNILFFPISSLLTKTDKIEKEIKCKKCNFYFNKYSKTYSENTDNKDLLTWNCESCNEKNLITMNDSITNFFNKLDKNDYEIVKEKSYIETPKDNNNNNNTTPNDNLKIDNNTTILYCFDISGSMSSMYMVDRQTYLKIKNVPDIIDKNKKYFRVNRLDCIKSAIYEGVNIIKEKNPNTKVGLISFNSEINIYGDTINQPLTISKPEILDNYDLLSEIGQKNSDKINCSINESYDSLMKQLNKIEANDCTAIGPSILIAINMLRNKKGSTIFLCTDGLANKGIGGLEFNNQKEESKKFYKKIGQLANELGIVINLITFKDEESEINILLEMIKESGGDISRVNPEKIIDDFNNILTNKIIGTNTKLTINLNKMLTFKNIDEDLENDGSTYIKNIGNSKENDEYYFEYKFKSSKKIASFNDIDIEKINEIYFQICIEYTNEFNEKIIRIITDKTKISTKKEEIEKNANFDVVMNGIIQKQANLSMQNKINENNIDGWKEYINKQDNINSSTTKIFNQIISNFENIVISKDKSASHSYNSMKNPSHILKKKKKQYEKNKSKSEKVEYGKKK